MRTNKVLILSTVALSLAAACQRELPTDASSAEADLAFAKQVAAYSTTFVPLLAGDVENRANGVNDAGEVVGYGLSSALDFRAFVTLGGAVTALDGAEAQAFAISNGATRYVVGRVGSNPVKWTIVGTAAGSAASLALGSATRGSALGVNDAGDAIGYAGASAAVWDAAGTLTLVATPSGFTDGEGRDIDNAGNGALVFTRPEAGWEGGFAAGYLRTATGQLIHLPPLSGDVVTYVNGLGPAGGNLVRVAGSSYSAPSTSRAVRWTVDVSTGAIVGTEVRPEASHALALADDGTAAGFIEGQGGSLSSNAFRWQSSSILKLNPPKGAKMGRAWAISPNGRYIAGTAMQQRRRAVLWTFPAP